jgi:hypothetical protein
LNHHVGWNLVAETPQDFVHSFRLLTFQRFHHEKRGFLCRPLSMPLLPAPAGLNGLKWWMPEHAGCIKKDTT